MHIGVFLSPTPLPYIETFNQEIFPLFRNIQYLQGLQSFGVRNNGGKPLILAEKREDLRKMKNRHDFCDLDSKSFLAAP